MGSKLIPKEPDTVACEVCLSEIPESVAINQEAADYTLHFCGIECYNLWKEKQEKKRHSQH